MTILKANGLEKSFGRRKVVDGVTLEIDAGEIVGLFGTKRAGKTTTFRMICGMLARTKAKSYCAIRMSRIGPCMCRTRRRHGLLATTIERVR